VIDILGKLDYESISNCLQVCQDWKQFFEEFHFWRKLFLRKYRNDFEFRQLCDLNGWSHMHTKSDQFEAEYRKIMRFYDDCDSKNTSCDVADDKVYDSPKIKADSIISFYKYFDGHVYIATVVGEVSKYDIISQEQKVIMSGHGRVYCIDIKDDILVVGLPSGLIRFRRLLRSDEETPFRSINVNEFIKCEDVGHVVEITFSLGHIVGISRTGNIFCFNIGIKDEPSLIYSFNIHPNELSWCLLGSHHFLTVTSHLNDEGVEDPKARFYDSLTVCFRFPEQHK